MDPTAKVPARVPVFLLFWSSAPGPVWVMG
jgi:hypothetical protein